MLKEQVAIVTGASRGIGKEIAVKLAEQGMKLVIAGSSEEINQTADEMKQKGFSDVIAVQTDVSDEQQVKNLVEKTVEAFGQVDVLVNNAGIGFFKLAEEVTVDEWKKLFEVNVQGVFLGAKAVLPHMKERKSGTIITISSDVGRYTIPNGSAYTASKYAVQGFSGALAQEVREFGIRVGTINPGMVDTYFADSKQGLPEKHDWLKVEDIANAVVYMASAPKHMLIDEIVIHPLVQNYPIA
ncbi:MULTISPECIES: SDR family oxidoreductase [unclassified Bacillus (in: firmicutes)]|uniref:SDR family oxidoreductase n=1 Tax=unclassified Bacillus (in: firmicutes) TaxID=185979 RepID=UPI001BE5EEC2|nr:MULTISPECIES: SDR family oxidoreductase [unclassified Bacillus (in: firmicutes)]MBT2640308.1 SDR family oxidoreductase [Bacillus sp. ISL-39]MBT2662718.1 SDR family oxidoreductase [Bacillus sp. ISL-45]